MLLKLLLSCARTYLADVNLNSNSGYRLLIPSKTYLATFCVSVSMDVVSMNSTYVKPLLRLFTSLYHSSAAERISRKKCSFITSLFLIVKGTLRHIWGTLLGW
jgi:hypothetical protein